MWSHRSARGFFALDSKPSKCAHFFRREEETFCVEDARAYVRRETKLMLRLRLQGATCLLCLLCLLPRASRARLSESDQSTSIMKSAQPSGKPDSYEDRRETHGFLVTSLVPTRSEADALRANPKAPPRHCAFHCCRGNERRRGRKARQRRPRRCRMRAVREDERSGERPPKTRNGRDRRNDETNASR